MSIKKQFGRAKDLGTASFLQRKMEGRDMKKVMHLNASMERGRETNWHHSIVPFLLPIYNLHHGQITLKKYIK
jgi:hypothetical protein